MVNPATGLGVHPTYQYAYDVYGNQVSTTDALGRQTLYTYDQYGHKVSETLPMTQQESWHYNTLGQLDYQCDFDGNKIVFTYDTLGRLATKAVYAYTNLTTAYETVTYAYNQNYDAQGDYHNTVTSSLTGTTDSEFDVNGNLIKITSPQGTVNYAYDLSTGNKTEVWTNNTDIHFGYDQAGELTTVTVTKLDGQTLSSPLVTMYGYDLDGNLLSTQNANGTTESRLYDLLNRLTSIVDTGPAGAGTSPSGVIASFAYTYDLAGHILTETDLTGRVDIYSYDYLYRLTQQSISDPSLGSRTLTWSYDLVGDRVASSDNGPSGPSLTYLYNNNDELVSISNSSGVIQQFSYDANGSTLQAKDGSGTVLSTSTWTPTGMLSTYTSGSTSVSYTYDDSGNRTSETVNGSKTTFLTDPLQAYDQVLEEYANSGLAATFVRGINLILQDRSRTLSTYVSDNLGSTRFLTSSTGAVTDTVTYDAYGNILVGTGHTTNEFLYAGMQFDSAVGQYYDHVRDYNVVGGRFLSRDPVAGHMYVPPSLNRYEYAFDDPANLVDPSGMDSLGEVLTAISIGINGISLGGHVMQAIQAYKRGNDAEFATHYAMAMFDLAFMALGAFGLIGGGLGGDAGLAGSELVATASAMVRLGVKAGIVWSWLETAVWANAGASGLGNFLMSQANSGLPEIDPSTGANDNGPYTRYDIHAGPGDEIETTLQGSELKVDWTRSPNWLYYLGRIQKMAGPGKIRVIKGYVTADLAELVKDPNYVQRLVRAANRLLTGNWEISFQPEGVKTFMVFTRTD